MTFEKYSELQKQNLNPADLKDSLLYALIVKANALENLAASIQESFDIGEPYVFSEGIKDILGVDVRANSHIAAYIGIPYEEFAKLSVRN